MSDHNTFLSFFSQTNAFRAILTKYQYRVIYILLAMKLWPLRARLLFFPPKNFADYCFSQTRRLSKKKNCQKSASFLSYFLIITYDWSFSATQLIHTTATKTTQHSTCQCYIIFSSTTIVRLTKPTSTLSGTTQVLNEYSISYFIRPYKGISLITYKVGQRTLMQNSSMYLQQASLGSFPWTLGCS